VPDLCAGVSRRALQYAVENVLQLSPVTDLRVMRLNRVRQVLRSEPEATVGDVAARWGFWHPSRFAADDRALFGELPSATRAQSATAQPIVA
jgi:AraC family ethanolamine operon transcriptional activator